MTCILCDIATGAAPGHILSRDERIVVVLALEGHPLVLPRGHVPDLAGLDDATAAAMMKMATRVAGALRARTGCEGVNLVLSDGAAAGQDVFHLHLHVKPRWRGDGVALRWDTAGIAGEERDRLAQAIAEHLDEGARKERRRPV